MTVEDFLTSVNDPELTAQVKTLEQALFAQG